MEQPNTNQEVYVGAHGKMFHSHRLEEYHIGIVSYIQRDVKEQQERAESTKFSVQAFSSWVEGLDQQGKFQPKS